MGKLGFHRSRSSFGMQQLTRDTRNAVVELRNVRVANAPFAYVIESPKSYERGERADSKIQSSKGADIQKLSFNAN